MEILGQPNEALSNKEALRFGTKGSLHVTLAGEHRGTWYSHETDKGGGALDLIHEELGITGDDAIEWLREHQIIDAKPEQSPRKLVAEYIYKTADGTPAFKVCKYSDKSYPQYQPDGRGGWKPKTRGAPKVPFRLPELLAASTDTAVYIAEGEKDCLNLVKLGFVASCNAMGASKSLTKCNWLKEYSGHFRERHVCILADNDEISAAHAQKVAKSLRGIAALVRVLLLPGLPPKGDVSD